MGRLRSLGGLRRVGVRAAPAIVGRVGQVRQVGQASRKGVCKMFILRLSFAYPSLNVR
ncbi:MULTISPECIES: hypothetical protein [Capnocytophaga]|uniref:hypothetical protein n=1 Tax=Capnocytophaga TaxID=1016 RepID=UPI0018C88964|nr:hypothetical protein [Capnocytophaga sp. FDAARGOS_737]